MISKLQLSLNYEKKSCFDLAYYPKLFFTKNNYINCQLKKKKKQFKLTGFSKS